MSPRSHVSAVSLACFLVAACATPPPATESPRSSSEPVPSSTATASTQNDAGPPAIGRDNAVNETPAARESERMLPRTRPRFSSWNDRAGIAWLAENCHAKAIPVWRDDQHGTVIDPLSCDPPPEQSCVYDPCFTRKQDCREECGATCENCDDQCGLACDACKAACSSAACRTACARRTATCKAACLTANDRCASAGCTRKAKQCRVEEKQKWMANQCSFSRIEQCVQACHDEPDWNVCLDTCRTKFPGCDVRYTIVGSDPALWRN